MDNDEKLIKILQTKNQIVAEREQYVAMANALAEQARTDLSVPELRLLRYVLSKVEPDDTADVDYEIDIRTFLRVCGMATRSGANYNAIKRQIESLWLKHFWIRDARGKETGIQWILHPTIDIGSGIITCRLDPSIHKYVLNLIHAGRYFQYRLLYILPMRSEYSIRLYEFLKAGGYKKRTRLVELDTLREALECVGIYENYKDFRRRSLQVAIDEINAYTDLFVSYEPVYRGRAVRGIEFTIRQRHAVAVEAVMDNDHKVLDEQMSIYDYL